MNTKKAALADSLWQSPLKQFAFWWVLSVHWGRGSYKKRDGGEAA